MLREHAAPGRQRSGSSPTFSISKKNGTLAAKTDYSSHDPEILFRVQCPEHEKCGPYSNFSGKKEPLKLNTRFESVNQRVVDQKEKRKMTTIMIIKMNETEAKRFWGVQKRLLTLPLSEKQILRLKGDSYKDA